MKYAVIAKKKHGDGSLYFVELKRLEDEKERQEMADRNFFLAGVCDHVAKKYLEDMVGGFGFESTPLRERSGSPLAYAQSRIEFAKQRLGDKHFN